MSHSEIVHHKTGGTSFVGADAVNLYRAVHVKQALLMYAKTGLKMTRGATPAVLLAIARQRQDLQAGPVPAGCGRRASLDRHHEGGAADH